VCMCHRPDSGTVLKTGKYSLFRYGIDITAAFDDAPGVLPADIAQDYARYLEGLESYPICELTVNKIIQWPALIEQCGIFFFGDFCFQFVCFNCKASLLDVIIVFLSVCLICLLLFFFFQSFLCISQLPILSVVLLLPMLENDKPHSGSRTICTSHYTSLAVQRMQNLA
jgi:hypothetical protein